MAFLTNPVEIRQIHESPDTESNRNIWNKENQHLVEEDQIISGNCPYNSPHYLLGNRTQLLVLGQVSDVSEIPLLAIFEMLCQVEKKSYGRKKMLVLSSVREK